MLLLAKMATATNTIGMMCSSLDSVAPPPSVRADSTYVGTKPGSVEDEHSPGDRRVCIRLYIYTRAGTGEVGCARQPRAKTYKKLDGYCRHQRTEKDDSDGLNSSPSLYVRSLDTTPVQGLSSCKTYHGIGIHARPGSEPRSDEHDKGRYKVHLPTRLGYYSFLWSQGRILRTKASAAVAKS